MSNSQLTPGVVPGRLPAAAYDANFADKEPPFDRHEAHVAADRCYFCYDAPCITACPTSIDIPLFIRQIATGTPEAAAKTIWDQNILGGMCARVCPTEQLCEEACVREAAEGKPVEIGRLQRYATDTLMAEGSTPIPARRPRGGVWRWWGRGPRGWPAPIAWRCTGMRSRCSTRGPRSAGSTNTPSPPTRRRGISRRPRWNGC